MFTRYEFKTKVANMRAMYDTMIQMRAPFWRNGSVWKGDERTASKIVCYLPEDVEVADIWPDAYDIVAEHKESIEYTDDFPKPKWIG